MASLLFYAIVSVSLVSIISLFGISVLRLNRARLTFFMIPLATGAMLGNVTIHLIPEAFAYVAAGTIPALTVSVLFLSGFISSMFLDRVLHLWCHHSGGQHHAESECEESGVSRSHFHIHPTGHMSIIAHGMDNLTDGVLIASSYLISIPAGLAMTLAVILHEIPLEFGMFGVLIHSGYSPARAVAINFLSGIVALTGTCLVFGFGSMVQSLPVLLTPIGAGIVLYITACSLIPGLLQETNTKRSLAQMASMLLGIGLMLLVKIWG